MKSYNYLAASNYNCDAYGEGTFSSCDSDQASATGPLANTGFDIIIPVALAVSLIVAGVLYAIKRYRSRQ